MLKFSKAKRKAIGSLIAAGFLFGTTSLPPVAYAADSNNSILFSALASQLGGIPIPGTTASYMPQVSGDVKAVPLCYVTPSQPQANETAQVICALVKTDPGTIVESATPDLGLGNKKVLFSSVSLGESKASTYFSWHLYREIPQKDKNGNATTPKKLEGDAFVVVTIAPYTGASSLSNNGDPSDTGTGVTTGTTNTTSCNEDNTICYTYTCDTDGKCNTTCSGPNCPDTSNTGSTSPGCEPGYQMNDSGSCVFTLSSDGCQSGYTKNDDGVCVQPKTDTECTSSSDSTLCTDCMGSVCIPYNPSECVTGSICTNTGTTGGTRTTSGTTDTGSSLDDAAQKALNNLFDDSGDDSYNAPTDDWLDSADGTDGAENLDDYLGDASSSDNLGDGVPEGATTDTGDFDNTGDGSDNYGDDEAATGDGYSDTGSTGSTSGSNGNKGDGSLGSLLNKYQDGTTGLDALMNGDNGDLLGRIKGSTSSLSDKLTSLLGLNDDTSATPSKSNNDLYDIARQMLLANGMTMDDIKNGRNYDANSAFTEPKTSWDMNRITTLIRNKKLKVDDKGNAVESSTKSSGNEKAASSSSSSPSSGSSGNTKNASLTKK